MTPERTGRRRPSAALIGVGDQGLSSLGNLLATIAVARAAGPAEFGAFGVLLSLYLLGITVGRGVVGSVTSIEAGSSQATEHPAYMSSAASAACAIGLIVAGAAAVGASFSDGDLAHMLTILALTAPFLVLQDALRFASYSANRPGVALGNTAAWLGLQFVLFALLFASQQASPSFLAGAWAASSIAGCLVGTTVLKVRFSPARAVRWFTRGSSLVRSLGIEQLLMSGVAHGVPLIVAALSGLSAVGALRAAITLLGPVTALAHGTLIALVPAAARRWAAGRTDFARRLTVVGASIGSACFAWSLLLLVLPTSLGEALLGRSWAGARELVPYVGAWFGLGYIAEPAINRLRITGRNWVAARLRLLFAPISLVSAVIGSILGDARGAVIAVISVTAVSAISFWSKAIDQRD